MKYQPYHDIDNNPKTNAHLAEIVESIRANGWTGLPLLACGDQLYNGCHRLAACEILGIEPAVHQMELGCDWGENEYTDFLLDGIFTYAHDTFELLRGIKALREENLIDDLSYQIIKAEYDKE